VNINNQEIDAIIEEVRNELRVILLKRKKMIEKLGFAFEKVVANKESICEEIKNCLKEEIALGIISTRTIEQCCRPEWKKKTRPKLENEKFSFSDDKLQMEEEKKRIAIDTQGNVVQDLVSNTKSTDNDDDTNRKDDFNQQEKQMTIQDNEIVQSPDITIKRLIYENKKIQQERDNAIDKLEDALETIFVQKQKELELVKKYENITTQLTKLDTVFDIEFSVDYKPLQNHMKDIYNSAVRQVVWFTAKIDAHKNVISVQIGRKLLHQNQEFAETSK
jgi:hypothetical protein